MHKYDKRFTGGNQLAYCRHKKYLRWQIVWDWRSIRKEEHKLRNNPNEDDWDKIATKLPRPVEPDFW